MEKLRLPKRETVGHTPLDGNGTVAFTWSGRAHLVLRGTPVIKTTVFDTFGGMYAVPAACNKDYELLVLPKTDPPGVKLEIRPDGSEDWWEANIPRGSMQPWAGTPIDLRSAVRMWPRTPGNRRQPCRSCTQRAGMYLEELPLLRTSMVVPG